MATKLLLLTHPVKFLPEVGSKASPSCHPRWSSCPTDSAGKQAFNFLRKPYAIITPHLLISNSYPSAQFASNFTCTQLRSALTSKSASRSVISSCQGMTSSASAVVSDASGSGQEMHVNSTHDLTADGSLPKLPLSPLLIALAIPLIAGTVDSYFNNPNKPWYKSLKKPAWTPPGWIFGLVWSVLYGGMGFASWLVWTQGGWKAQAYPLIAYSLQLVLNLSWVAVFFGAENLGLAMLDMILLIIAIAACIAAFQPVNTVAADLMKVYLVWVLFAAFLNYTLWVNNKHPRVA